METPSSPHDPGDIASPNEVSRRRFLELFAKTLAALGGIGFASRLGLEFAYHRAEKQLPNPSSDITHYMELEEGLFGRKPLETIVEQTFREPTPSADTPVITDERGCAVAQGPIDTEAYQQPAVAARFKEFQMQPEIEEYHILFGDSYLLPFPPEIVRATYPTIPSNVVSWATPGTSPLEHLRAARRLFNFQEESNREFRSWLDMNPSAPITLTFYITPHNDLEALADKLNIHPVTNATPLDRREFFRRVRNLVAPAVGINTPQREAIARQGIYQVFGKNITGNRPDMTPAVDDPRILYLHNELNTLRKELSRSLPGHSINIELIPLLSFYDTPEAPYTWHTTLRTVFPEEYYHIANPRDLVIQGAQLNLYSLDELFLEFDQHYSPLGRSVMAIAIRWAREGRVLSTETAKNFKSAYLGLMQESTRQTELIYREMGIST